MFSGTVLIFLLTLMILSFLERRYPYLPAKPSPTLWRGSAWSILFRLVEHPLRVWLMAKALFILGNFAHGKPYMGIAAQWSFWPQLVTAFLLLDFLHWGVHYLTHRVPLLWMVHATHHAPRHMFWGASFYISWLNLAIYAVAHAIPAAIFGFHESVLTIFFTFRMVTSMAQHANIDISLGKLNYIFACWDVHRWHHALDRDQWDKNFATLFSFWDLLFGTFEWPKGRKPQGYGVGSYPDYPEDFLQGQWFPLAYYLGMMKYPGPKRMPATE